jgi:hypothetical protein
VQQLSQEPGPAPPSDPSQQLQLEAKCEALQLRLDEAASQLLAANQAQRAAEAHVAQLQQEIAHVHASSPARGPPQLEQQVAELQELLYQKQQQLERLSADKQAQQLMLERQVCCGSRMARYGIICSQGGPIHLSVRNPSPVL